jgi:hypothetical protein
MAVVFQVEVFCVVTPCSVVVGYQHFRGLCCLHLQGEVKMEAVKCWYTTTLNSTWHHNPEDLDLKCCMSIFLGKFLNPVYFLIPFFTISYNH